MPYFNFREEKAAEVSPKHFHKQSQMQAKYFRDSFVFLCLGYWRRFHTITFQIPLQKKLPKFQSKEFLEAVQE